MRSEWVSGFFTDLAYHHLSPYLGSVMVAASAVANFGIVLIISRHHHCIHVFTPQAQNATALSPPEAYIRLGKFKLKN